MSCFCRTLLESFFRRVATQIQEDESLKEVLRTSKLLKSHRESAMSGPRASMTSINAALEVNEFRNLIWEQLKLPENLPMAAVSGELLYGDLSSTIHLPGFSHVYISSSASTEYIIFFKELVKVTTPQLTVVIYSEENSAKGQELFGSV